jgi:hypothetical protein
MPPRQRTPFGMDKGPSKSDFLWVIAREAAVAKMMGCKSHGSAGKTMKAQGLEEET